VREGRDEQSDQEAEEVVDDQQERPHERSPDAARRALRVHDPQSHDLLADARAGDALQQNEIQKAQERGQQIAEGGMPALPRIDAVAELRANAAEAAVTQRPTRTRGRARVRVIPGSDHDRNEDPGEEDEVDDVRDDASAQDFGRIALRLHSVSHTGLILPHREPRAGGCRSDALW
jgi:hypothetical protein